MIENLFAHLPDMPEAAERFETLLDRPGLKIERIVSTGHCSPPGFWYDQVNAEWVVVLRGQAVLRIEGEPGPRTLLAGDFIEIPAHRRHRVDATSADGPTVWLAIHY
jgi:cupin 2 domain-containing protein